MSVKVEKNGRRSIQVEAEVPGTPEEVWRAIATGPGISSWFVPAKVEEREGGSMSLTFGPGMDLPATITAWEPPHRMVADSPIGGPDTPVMATEWIVESKGGGTCIVRVVHSLFASTDDWDDQLEGTENGWPGWFRILRLVLTHFRGQTSSSIFLMSFTSKSVDETWQTTVDSLGFAEMKEGSRLTTGNSAPKLQGTVDRIVEKPYRAFILLLEKPAPGIVFLAAHKMGEQVCIFLRVFFYGEHPEQTVTETEPAWETWLNQTFPTGG
jgi:uncharacterized protein YndB with AHSA1/START domain